jgi:hypothetical protein
LAVNGLKPEAIYRNGSDRGQVCEKLPVGINGSFSQGFILEA